MHPELFVLHFADREIIIMSYSFFYALAIVFVIVGGYWALLKNGNTHKKIVCMIGSMGLAGLVGARLLHFVFNLSAYRDGQLHLFDLHMRGFTIVGGLLFAIIVGWFVSKKCNVNVWKFGDILVPFVAFGIAIARVGCFLNGCCFGHTTTLPWGIKFPILSFAHQYQISHGLSNFFTVLRVHPTQLYEMLYAIIGGVIVIIINRKKIFDGAGILFFGMWFSLFRLFNSFFRQMPDTLKITQLQYGVIYVGIFLFCFFIFLYLYRKIKNSVI
jgi:phosphatidylglycerol:prolipoprotein diacylglycerol transferase